MKIVVCENCGAKYQIGNAEDVDDYECYVCAGNLQSIQNYPSTNSQSNQNHNASLYRTYNSNSEIVRCKNCGLKYNIWKNETPGDYECSSCFGELCYVDEELNRKFEEELKLKKSSLIENENHGNNILQNDTDNNQNTDSQKKHYNQKQNIVSKQNLKSKKVFKTNIENIDDLNIISPLNETNINKIERKLRRKIEKDFSYNLKESYGDPIGNIKEENIENTIKKKIEEDNRNQLPENIAIDKEIAELNNASKSELDKINDALKTSNKKHDLIPHPNVKNNFYHDIYIVAGLIIASIGVSSVLLSQRVYGIIFIGIGIVLFIIGLIKNKKFAAAEKRGKIIREKLLTLPEKFYVLYFVKVPNANYCINHVIVGSSGIFSIVNQSYNEKKDKEKTKTDNINLLTKSKLNDLTLFDDSKNEYITNNDKNRINNRDYLDNDNKKNHTDEIKETSKHSSEDMITADKNNQNNSHSSHKNIDSNNNNNNNNNNDVHDKLNTSKNQTKFKFIEGQKRFDHDNKIKQKSIHLSEELINFLNENGLIECYVEPLVGFVNKEVAVINMPLTDEDLFLDELLQKIVHGKRQLDDATTHKVAVLLSQYSTECSS